MIGRMLIKTIDFRSIFVFMVDVSARLANHHQENIKNAYRKYTIEYVKVNQTMNY